MGAPRQARAGIPISVKLILATSIVVAAAVGTATWFAQKSVNDLTETSIAIRRETGERSIVRESELVVKAVATAVAFPLSTGTLADIPSLLDSTFQEKALDFFGMLFVIRVGFARTKFGNFKNLV